MASLVLVHGGHGIAFRAQAPPGLVPKEVGTGWKLVSAHCGGAADDNKGNQQWPQKVCSGFSALLMFGQQNLCLLPLLGEPPPLAHATGLLLMPPEVLNNRYFLVRAGLSKFESQGFIHTNPVSKTSVDSGLSHEGFQQTAKAAIELQAMGACEGSCWIWPSITQRSYQAAELIAATNQVNYSRIVPEYSFLDARGLGAYENRKLSEIGDIYAQDLESSTARPPKFDDGTPNESVKDVLVRVTQLMSILETQYFGDTVIIVSPDSDNLSILQAALTGQDIRGHSTLAFAPGEVRKIDNNDIPVRRPLISGRFKIHHD